MSGRGFAALLSMTVAAGLVSGSVSPADATGDRPQAAAATFPGGNGRIAYTKSWEASGERRSDVFSVRPNGSGHQRLTFSRSSSTPKWSPNGRRIAFERAGTVWLMRADGSGKQRLTSGELVGWMPHGGQVLVVRGLGDRTGTDPTWLLHTIATGAEEQLPIDLPLVTGPLEPPYQDYDDWRFASDPTLSPDGELLALMLWRSDWGDDQYEHNFGSFFTVRLDGTELTRLPKYTYSFGSPGWSPDGGQLVYWSSEPRGYCSDQLRSIRLDGTSGSVDISRPCGESDPEWSPDGRRIVFSSSVTGRVHVATRNGARVTTVLPGVDGVDRSEPDWQSIRR